MNNIIKKLFFVLFLIIFLSSCKDPVSKYDEGDIVYLKPDSTIGLITFEPLLWDESTYVYRVEYKDIKGERYNKWYSDKTIFGKK